MDPTILQSLGGAALGTVGAVGNLLDVPGSMVRDTLAGKNPFDQILTPFGDENRTSGRDLARSYGLAGNKDTWGNFAGGLATEVLTDPLTVLGVSALGKTAQGARLAKTGATTAKNLGGGIRAGERALLAGKVPFGPRWAVGTGEKAAKVGDKLDAAYKAGRNSYVGRGVAASFDRANRGVMDIIGQRVARRATELHDRSLAPIKSEQLAIARELKDRRLEDAVAFRGDMEEIPQYQGYLPPELKQRIRQNLETTRKIKRAYGLSSDILDDDYTQFFPRGVRAAKGDIEDQMRQVAGVHRRADRRRDIMFKNWHEGTAGINELMRDKDIAAILKKGDSGIIDPRQTKKELYEHIKENWNHRFDPEVKTPGERKLNPEWTKFVSGPDSPKVKLRTELKDKFAADLLLDRKGTLKKINAMIRAETPPKMIIPVVKRERAKMLANYIYGLKDEVFQEGLFNRQPLDDFHSYQTGNWKSITNAHALNEVMFDFLPDYIKKYADPNAPKDYALGHGFDFTPISGVEDLKPVIEKTSRRRGKDTVSLSQLYRHVGYKNPNEAVSSLLMQHGIGVDEDTLSAAMNTRIPKESAKALRKVMDNYRSPEQIGWIKDAYKQYLNWFKSGVLAHPATKVRDYLGGVVHNQLHGMATALDYAKAHALYMGKPVKGLFDRLKENRSVAEWATKNGMPFGNDKDATEVVKYLYASRGPGDAFKHTDVSGSVIESAKDTLDGILGSVPGYQPGSIKDSARQFARTFIGKDGASRNPTKVRGVFGNTETTFGPIKAFEKTSEYTDTMNRLSPFMKMLGDGFDPDAAMRRINDVQVNYDPKMYTETEKMLKQVFPFYSYTSRMGKHIAKELATNPGGGVANAVRVQNTARDRSGMTPDHIADSAAISLGKNGDASRYLTGLGLMHEDALQFMQPSVRNLLSETASRLNPLAQKAIEGATGRSLFFKGPDGGRAINDLDPTIGRILANVTGQEDAVSYPGSQAVESIVGATPYSRIFTSLRQATDPRKGPLTKALNLGTGIKITDVSPKQQEQSLRRKLEAAAKEMGGRTFEQIYFPESKTYSGQAKERVDAYKEIINALSRRAKSRAKDKLKKDE